MQKQDSKITGSPVLMTPVSQSQAPPFKKKKKKKAKQMYTSIYLENLNLNSIKRP